MDVADKARADGHMQKARDAYRAAAAVYPSEHSPWVRLAQSHFEAADYGNAIVASEEALQRNPHDQTAVGIMAVSGLRVSSRAVANLNEKDALGDSRSQAEAIVLKLRTVLGEPALVKAEPAAPSALSADTRASAAVRPVSKASNKPTVTPVPAVVPVSASPVLAPAQGTPTRAPPGQAAPASTKRASANGNPLDALR